MTSKVYEGMEFSNFVRPVEYIEDYFAILLEQEKNIPNYKMQSPQLNFRKELLDWMASLSKSTKLSILTFHLGALIMDCFMDLHDIRSYRLKSVVAGSLMLAAKLEQSGGGVPLYSSLFALGNFQNNELPEQSIMFAIEIRLFQFFNFQLLLPTVAHYIYFFLPDAVQLGDLRPETQGTSKENEIRMEMRDLLLESLHILLYDAKTLSFAPSHIASACVFLARVKLQLSPSWTPYMEKITGYSQAFLEPALRFVNSCTSRCDGQLPDTSSNSNVSTSDFDSGYKSSGNQESMQLSD